MAENIRIMKAEADEREKVKLELLEEEATGDYEDLSEYIGYTLVEDGRTEEQPVLIYDEQFELENLANKAGANYLLSVGKLIGAQVALKEEEIKERKGDVDMSRARTFNYHIEFTLPEGYQVEGLEGLVYQVDNEYGAFTSKAEVKEGLLVIDTRKEYKNSHVALENWPQMVEFLEAAYDFTQKKVILKK